MRRRRGPVELLLALLIALTTAGSLASAASAQTTSAPTKTVSYRGVQIAVPASWPVYDLLREPRRCVLFNTSAVYLGDQAAEAQCPASAVGVAPAIQLRPSTGSPQAAATAVDNVTAHRISATSSAGAVDVTISYVDHDATLSRLLTALAATKIDRQTPRPAPSASRPTTPAGATGSPEANPRAVATAAGRAGLGFDTCGAPSPSAMATWFATSPYRTAGIYLGGVNRACPDGNLSAAWVNAVGEQGWQFIPTYVGLQAPCVFQAGLAVIDPASASAEGRSAADDAVVQATRFGMHAGTPIYFDSEAYDVTVPGCSQTMLAFLSGWTSELHAQNFTSGVYGSSASTMHDLDVAVGTGPYAAPDDIWFANWNDQTELFDPLVSNNVWTNHQRIHQYHGGHDETYGGTTINIDNDSVDGATAIPGNGPPQSLQVFSATSTGQVLTSWQFAPGKPYDPWLDLQVPAAPAGAPVVGLEQNGELQLFVHTKDNRMLTSWQAGASHPFGGWVAMGADGQIASDATAGLDANGDAQIVVRGASGQVLTSWQRSPNQAFGGWLNLGLPAKAAGVPVVAREANGGMQVFVHTADNRLVTSWQAGAGQPFGGWLDLGLSGQIGFDPSIGLNTDGSMVLTVQGTRGRVLTSWQSAPNQPFGGWLDLGFPAQAAGVPATVREANGGLQVFVHTADNRLVTSWQSGAGQPFGGWLGLGLDGQVASDASGALNADGTMSIVVRGAGGRVLTSWQAAINQGFGGWLDLGLPQTAIAIPEVSMNRGG